MAFHNFHREKEEIKKREKNRGIRTRKESEKGRK